jgi:peptide-methionine (R)-S-oxide reductase
MNEEEIKQKLTEEEYRVLRKGETEVPFSGKYYAETRKGTYNCKVCDNPLFASDTKFHSDLPGLAGWPSFDDAIAGSIEHKDDYELGIHRIEVVCAKCKSHLGHIFDDHEAKTGKHYCINSICLDLKPTEE